MTWPFEFEDPVVYAGNRALAAAIARDVGPTSHLSGEDLALPVVVRHLQRTAGNQAVKEENYS